MDFQLRRRHYNRCDPGQWLPPDDPRNVDLDAPSVSGGRVRGVNWVDKLARAIELADRPAFELFSGLRGSGKSTELERLAGRLSRRDGANLLPVVVRAEELLDLTSRVDVPDVWVAILHTADREVLRAEGANGDEAMAEGVVRRLWNFVTRTEIDLPKLDEAITEDVLKTGLALQMRDNPSVRERVRTAVARHLTRFLAESSEELLHIEARARAVGRAGLVVIFDSLEKLRGTSSSWNEVLQSVEKMFAADAPYLRLPVHVVYTVPPALLGRTVTPVHFLPMIKVREPDGREFEPGIEAARALIRSRVPDPILGELLGPTSCEARARRIILRSGGYPRDIVRVLRGLFALPDGAIGERDFERVLTELGEEYTRLVTADAVEWLARVADEGRFVVASEAHRQIADRMLSENIVLRYVNDREWYNVLPAVREMPDVAAALARRRSARP